MEAGWSARLLTSPFGVVPPQGNWTAAEGNQVVFRDKSRFNLSSDDNRVRVWRSRSEHLDPEFDLQRHDARTANAMVWGAAAYNTLSPLV
ncbi:transposable element Tcb2 transposase [Trichonephila clavipes]|nr:transposable element Tcb2 transposase [Trichonephila clavipes]